jgi:hypothetical protein
MDHSKVYRKPPFIRRVGEGGVAERRTNEDFRQVIPSDMQRAAKLAVGT